MWVALFSEFSEAPVSECSLHISDGREQAVSRTLVGFQPLIRKKPLMYQPSHGLLRCTYPKHRKVIIE
jgi:hypothetical protein